MQNIASKYDPHAIEERWYQYWLEKKIFRSEPDQRKAYTVVIPPPNVTGVLHMGHMLNNTIQDVLVRRARMQGKNACWVPGTDHASIATEAKVVNMLKERGIDKRTLTREQFMEYAWQWKEEHGGIILKQLRKLGASCDWDRTAFTMDEVRYESVVRVFVDLYNKGLIYRGVRMVNWDPKALTAVSDEEVIYKESHGKLFYLKYYVEGEDRYIVVATTRPETIMGDTAVCVHPDDERYQWLKGKRVVVPGVGRVVPIIMDEYVDREFGTGALKITPAHDINDYNLGMKYGLESIDIFNDNGTLNGALGSHPCDAERATAQRYAGMDRFACRKAIMSDLEAAGLVEKVEDYTNKVGHSERTDAVIEPKLSAQWFLKMDQLAQRALEVVEDDTIRFHPAKFKNTYRHWLENIKDWCISRQLWWGHRIPVFTCDACGWEDASMEDVEVCPHCGAPVRQDEDVLDTWFSSQLWTFATQGWPDHPEQMAGHHPTKVLVTARDIIALWVARMIMSSLYFCDEVPFHDVYIYATILAKDGSRMSKSKGNGVDPMDIEEKYGTDALRFVMASLCTDNQDVRLPVKKEKQPDGREINTSEKFEIGRNFSNKLWNACRFLYPQLEQAGALAAELPMDKSLFALEDKWILSRLQTTIKDATRMLEEYHFAELAGFLYRFVWDDVCSSYLEIKKAVINSEALTAEKKNAMAILSYVLKNVLDLLHPVMPFITEELNSILFQGSEMVISRAWPKADESLIDAKIEAAFDQAFAVVESVRGVRGRYNVSPATKLSAVVSVDDAATEASVKDCMAIITELSGLSDLSVAVKAVKPKFSASAVVPGGELYIPLEGILDPAAEIARLEKEIEKAKAFAASIEKKLSNQKFVSGAPEAVVNAERTKLATQQDIIAKNEAALKELK